MARAFTLDKGGKGGGQRTPISAVFIVMISWWNCLSLHAVFQAQLDVYNINSMCVNKEEVQGVSDTLPPTVKCQLKRKRPIVKMLENIPACSPSYKPLFVPCQLSKPSLPANCATPEAFFKLYIMFNHFELIARHTNINADQKRASEKCEEKGKS